MAEYLNHQLLEPLQKSLKEQESVKRHVEGEGDHFQRELADAHALFRRAKQAHDDCTLQAVEARAAYERLQLQPSIIRTKEYEKARLKSEAAQERQQIAKHAYRQQEEMFRSCQQRIIEQEMPKLMMRLREAEEHRSREVMSNLLAWIEMERRCAEQTESFTKEMNERIRQINLLADDQLYQQLHQQGPVIPQATAFHAILQPSSPPSPLTAAPNSNSYALMASSPITNPQTFNLPAYQHPNINLPRVPSMPPAYTVTQDLDMLMAAAAIPVAHTASAMCMLQSGDGDQ